MFELSAIQKQLQANAREFAKKEIAPRAAEVDRSENYPWKNVELLTNQGFMGMTIPKEYGGKGMTYLDTLLIIESAKLRKESRGSHFRSDFPAKEDNLPLSNICIRKNKEVQFSPVMMNRMKPDTSESV